MSREVCVNGGDGQTYMPWRECEEERRGEAEEGRREKGEAAFGGEVEEEVMVMQPNSSSKNRPRMAGSSISLFSFSFSFSLVLLLDLLLLLLLLLDLLLLLRLLGLSSAALLPDPNGRGSCLFSLCSVVASWRWYASILDHPLLSKMPAADDVRVPRNNPRSAAGSSDVLLPIPTPIPIPVLRPESPAAPPSQVSKSYAVLDGGGLVLQQQQREGMMAVEVVMIGMVVMNKNRMVVMMLLWMWVLHYMGWLSLRRMYRCWLAAPFPSHCMVEFLFLARHYAWVHIRPGDGIMDGFRVSRICFR